MATKPAVGTKKPAAKAAGHPVKKVVSAAKAPAATKTVAASKTSAKKTAAKTESAKGASRGTAQKKAKAKAPNVKGAKYSCRVCGMVVTVDAVCNCASVCDLICCSAPMTIV